MRIIGKICLSFIIIIVILLTASAFFLLSDFGHQQIINIVNAKIINGEIKFEKLSLNLLELSVEVKDIQIFSPESSIPVISVERIMLAVDFDAIVSQKKILVKYLTLDAPAVKLEFDERGSLILVSAFVNPALPQEPPAQEFNLQEFLNKGILDLFADIVVLKNTQVFFQKDNIKAQVSGLNLVAEAVDLRNLSLNLQLDAEKIAARCDSMLFLLDTLAIALSGSPKSTVNINNFFAVSSAKDTVKILAEVENPTNITIEPHLQFKLLLTANSSLNSLQNYNINVLPEGNSLAVKTRIRAKGTLNNPVANIRLIADSIQIAGYSSARLLTEIALDNQKITVKKLSAANFNAENFSGNADILAEADISALFPEGLIGKIDTSALALDKLSAEVETNLSVREKNTNEVVEIAAKAKLNNAAAKVDYLKIATRDKELLKIDGNYNLNSEEIDANVKLLPTNIAAFNDILKTPVENAVVSLDAKIDGTLSYPEISSHIYIRNARARGIAANSLKIKANAVGNIKDFTKSKANIAVISDTLINPYQNISRLSTNISFLDSVVGISNLSFHIGKDDSIKIGGKYHLNGKYAARIAVPNLLFGDIDAISTLPLFGHAKIMLFASGNINENIFPKNADLSVEVDTIAHEIIDTYKFPSKQNIYAEIHGGEIAPKADGILKITDGKIKLNENGEIKINEISAILLNSANITLNGNVSSEEIALNAAGDINLPKFTPLISKYLDSVSGKISFGAKVAGKKEEMSVSAQVNLENINGEIVLLEQKLRDLSGEIHYFLDTSMKVDVKNFAGKIDNGKFSVEGSVALARLPEVLGSANITLENMYLNYPDIANITLNTGILANFTTKSAQLHGTIDILDALFFQNIDANILSISGIAQNKGAFDNLGHTVSLRKQRATAFPVSLDFTIRPRGNILVENNLADLSLVPDITVGGTTQFPSVAGRIGITDGEIFFNNHTFEVTRGIIDFTDPYSIRPEVEISAESEINNYKITLNVSGDPQKELLFTFSSQPYLEDNDILSLILFGRITSDLANMQDDMRNALINSMLDNTPIAGVDISYDDGAISVSFERDISRKLSVGYSLEAQDGETVQTGKVSWKLSDFLKINGYSNTKNETGIGLEAEFERR